MNETIQRLLPNLVVHESRKIVDLRFAKAAFGVDEDTALAMIESGNIPWAFNIGSGTKLREVRVLAAALRYPPAEFTNLDEVLNFIIPAQRTNLRSGELCAWWDCGRDLLSRLSENGLVRGHTNGHTLWVDAASARDFLKRRRIT